jgi:hypothetical protein
MMAIGIDKIPSKMESFAQELDSFTSEPEEEEKPSGLALHQVFGQDSLNPKGSLPTEGTLPIQKLSNTAESEASTPSFWSKILSFFAWWYKPEVKAQTLSPSTPSQDLLEVDEPEPISPVPNLEGSDCIPPDLMANKKPPHSTKKNDNERLSQKQLSEGLLLMSKHTIEQIMMIICKAQIELERENAKIAEGSFSKYQEFKKLQEKVLEEIKDALVKDEKIVNIFNIAQIALLASFVCGLLAAASTGGLIAPLQAAATATFTALATASKAYFERQLNVDKAKHEQYNHQDKYFDDRIEDTRQQLIAIADTDSAFKERLINQLKRYRKMMQLLSEK